MSLFSSLLSLHSTSISSFFFFFNDTATTEIYTLSLHDALPISYGLRNVAISAMPTGSSNRRHRAGDGRSGAVRSEEHTSELQSRPHLVCRLLLEKKKQRVNTDRPETSDRLPA